MQVRLKGLKIGARLHVSVCPNQLLVNSDEHSNQLNRGSLSRRSFSSPFPHHFIIELNLARAEGKFCFSQYANHYARNLFVKAMKSPSRVEIKRNFT